MRPEIKALIADVAIKYGPQLALALSVIFTKKKPTLADVEKLFAGVKRYEDYGIPAIAPKKVTVKKLKPGKDDMQ